MCSESLSNDAIKLSILKRHRQPKHPDLAEKRLEYFQTMRETMQKHGDTLKSLSAEK